MLDDRTGKPWTTRSIGKVLRKIHPQLGRHTLRYALSMLMMMDGGRDSDDLALQLGQQVMSTVQQAYTSSAPVVDIHSVIYGDADQVKDIFAVHPNQLQPVDHGVFIIPTAVRIQALEDPEVVAQKAKVARRRERALQVCSTQDAFPKDIKVRLDTEWRAWRLAVSEVTARILSEAHSNLSSDRVLLQGIGQVVEAGETVGYDVEAMSQALVDFNSDVANGCDLVEFVEAQELIQDALGTAPTSFPDVATECMTASSNTSAHPAYQSPPATTITPVVRNELSQAWSDVTGSRPRQVVDAGVTVGYDPEAMS